MFALCLDRIVQQEPITAAHHLDAVGDKAASLVLARIDLEILLGAAEVEQDFGNGAIAFTAQAQPILAVSARTKNKTGNSL